MTELEYIPFGAGHADEGVCLLVRMGPYRILCDCGLVDLQALSPTFSYAPDPHINLHPDWPADFVICSHAHSDHARGLWALHQAFPDLPIYGSEVTSRLLPLNWLTVQDFPSSLAFCQSLPWRTPTELAPNLTVELYPAGHLPGAAACLFTYTPAAKSAIRNLRRAYTVFYTGDFLLSNSRLVDGLPLAELRGMAPDILILEGSFGTARHPHRRQQETQFADRVLEAVGQGTSVIMPVPILGLSQELLMLMRSHHTFTGKDIDIWVEDDIAQGCDVYMELLEHLPPTVQNFAQYQALFWDERVRPRVKRLGAQGLQLSDRPCIVLVSETADIQHYCTQSERSWLVLLPHHLPGQSFSGGRDEAGPADLTSGAENQGRISVDTYLLAEHCDGPGTTQLIHNLRPQHVVFMHGSPAYLADLISLEELANRYHLHSPRVGNRLELPVGAGLIQPTAATGIDAVFEGEVHELETEILATLPPQIRDDPRWRSFADTGMIEAVWQGEMLVLRGISQRELLLKTHRVSDIDAKGCASCQHYRVQHCWNPLSSLHSSKVAPEGYCPVFESSRPIE